MPGLVSFHSMATRDMVGTIFWRISSRFPLISVASPEKPVAFPPGRARLATTPAPTGSPTAVKTIGMVLVACRAAIAAGVVTGGPTDTLGRIMAEGMRASLGRTIIIENVTD